MHRLIIWLMLALMSLSACGVAETSRPGTVAPSPEASPSLAASPAASESVALPRGPSVADDRIAVLQRSGGLAGTSETISIRGDGTVAIGTGTRQATAEAARNVAAQLVATGIFDVPPGEYVPANQCCDRFTYDLTLLKDGTQYHYITMDGTPDAPPALMEAIALVQQFAAAAQ